MWALLPGISLGDVVIILMLHLVWYQVSGGKKSSSSSRKVLRPGARASPTVSIDGKSIHKRANSEGLRKRFSSVSSPDFALEEPRSSLISLDEDAANELPTFRRAPPEKSAPSWSLICGQWLQLTLQAMSARVCRTAVGRSLRRPKKRLTVPRLPSAIVATVKVTTQTALVLLSIFTWGAGLTVLMFVQTSRMDFAWERLFEMGSDVGIGLAWLPAMMPMLLRASFVTTAAGLCITRWRCHLLGNSAKASKQQLGFVLLLCLVVSMLVPAELSRTQNILIDVAQGIQRHRQPTTEHNLSHSAGGFYGSSNVDKPLLPGISQIPAKHVFVVLLESASSAAFPFSPSFCSVHGCDDIDAKYNNPEYMTPNYLRFLNQSLDARAMLSTSSFSIKSHFATMCGTMPHHRDFTSEHALKTALPCLPRVLSTVDKDFVTGHFTAGNLKWDQFDNALRKMGYDYQVSMPDIVGADMPCNRLTDAMCADDEILPLFSQWIDEKLETKKRIFASFSTINLHMDYYSPTKPVRYTKSRVANDYLNALHWTDKAFGTMLDMLESRGLLDESLIVVQGDHGDHLSRSPDQWADIGPFEAVYKAPLAFRFPRGEQSGSMPESPLPYSSLDILPTVLDAIGVDARLISPYYGRSALREDATSNRALFTTEAPGATTPMLNDGPLKLTMMKPGDFCAVDLSKDPTQQHPMCFDMWDKGGEKHWWGVDKDRAEEANLKGWIDWAHEMLLDHLAINKLYWQDNQEANVKSQAAYLTKARTLAQSGRAFTN